MRPSGRLGPGLALALCVLSYTGTPSQTNLLFTAGFLLDLLRRAAAPRGRARHRAHGRHAVRRPLRRLARRCTWCSCASCRGTSARTTRAGASYVLLAFLLTWCVRHGGVRLRAVARAGGGLLPTVEPEEVARGIGRRLAGGDRSPRTWRALWFAPYLTLGDATALGVVVGVFAQVGDLAESLLKRVSGAKDASELIPGHGGVLDRFDSLYFAAPLVYYYLKMVVFGHSDMNRPRTRSIRTRRRPAPCVAGRPFPRAIGSSARPARSAPQALAVVRAHRDRFRVVALAAGRNAARLAAQVAEFAPRLVVVRRRRGARARLLALHRPGARRRCRHRAGRAGRDRGRGGRRPAAGGRGRGGPAGVARRRRRAARRWRWPTRRASCWPANWSPRARAATGTPILPVDSEHAGAVPVPGRRGGRGRARSGDAAR